MLCRLYVNVITTIKGYGNYLWTDVVAQIDRMGEEVNAFQAQCKRLPKVGLASGLSAQPSQHVALRGNLLPMTQPGIVHSHALQDCCPAFQLEGPDAFVLVATSSTLLLESG